MNKKFNPKVTEINNIGDELRFQREYYNFKNPSKKLIIRKTIGVNEKTGEHKSEFLGDVLQNFLDNNFEYMKIPKKTDRENYGEYGTGEDILYAIEHNKLKSNKEKNNEKYNSNAYYLRMYSLFKIYGFCDDEQILYLLEKYNIKPRFEKTRIEVDKIKENIKSQFFELEFASISISFDEFEEINKNKSNFIDTPFRVTESRLYTTNIKKVMIERLKKYDTPLERKCLSLEIGEETEFLDNMIENKIKFVRCKTLLKLLKYLDLENTVTNYILKKRMKI